MDGHVIAGGGDVESGVYDALQIVESVRRVGGMAVLDWHTEAAMDRYCYRNQRTVLMALLARLRADSDAWFVTPWQLTQYWMERSRSLALAEVAR